MSSKRKIRMYMNLDKLNEALRSRSARSRPAGSLKIVTIENGREHTEWLNVFLATDRDTQQLKRSQGGQLVLNVKEQPEFQRLGDVLPAEDEISDQFSEAWQGDNQVGLHK